MKAIRKSQRGLKRDKSRQPLAFSTLVDTANTVVHSQEDVFQVSSVLWESINSPVSLGLHLRAKYLGIQDALAVTIDPHDYNDAEKFMKDLQAVKFLSKGEYTLPGVDRRLTALKNHDETEELCKAINEQLKRPSADVLDFLGRVRQSVSSILGPFPGAEEWADSCRFSAGTTQGGRAYLSDKMHKPTVTDAFYTLGTALVTRSPMWHSNCSVTVVAGETFSLVPKSWKTDRDIGVQPSLNIYAQLGLGRLMRLRLRRAGCDLDNGWKTNQLLALRGSLDASYATIDLKNASNSLSKELVYKLLPTDWFHALNVCRCSHQIRDQSPIELHRFSAMGNGYTFELESLIFLCIARVCLNDCGIQRREVTVFGDDIIVPSNCFNPVVNRLRDCGFTTNLQKSFSSSYFRESCGAQYFGGRDVRPVQAKYSKGNHYVPYLISLANGLRRASSRFYLNGDRDNFVRPSWVRVIQCIPKCIREALATTEDLGDDQRLLVDTRCTWYKPTEWHRWACNTQRVETPCLSITQESRVIYRWDTRLLVALFLMEEREKSLLNSTVSSEVSPISSSQELKKNGQTAIRIRYQVVVPGPEVPPL